MQSFEQSFTAGQVPHAVRGWPFAQSSKTVIDKCETGMAGACPDDFIFGVRHAVDISTINAGSARYFE